MCSKRSRKRMFPGKKIRALPSLSGNESLWIWRRNLPRPLVAHPSLTRGSGAVIP